MLSEKTGAVSQVLQDCVCISAILKDDGQVSLEGNRQCHMFACEGKCVFPNASSGGRELHFGSLPWALTDAEQVGVK